MTLEQLRIFVAVAEREHMTRAAQDLRLTQSATSAAISSLESRYATRLFDRVGRRIVLTDAGKLFLVEAKAVLAKSAAAELVLADLAGLKVGSLNLAASQTVGNYWLPAFLQSFREIYPGIRVSLAMGNTETVAAMVRTGEASLGFVEGDVDQEGLSVSSIADDEMVLIAPPDHRWRNRVGSEKLDVKSARWVLRELGSGTRAIFTMVLKNEGISPADVDINLVLPTNESIRAAVQAGAGVSIMSGLAVSNMLAAGQLISIKYDLPRRKFYMLSHKDRYITAAERELVRIIRERK